jgi:diguanylate cyclase (GGDEF)-like protein
MDKRASTRYVVSLNALVHPGVGRSWLCQIQDFCDAGMLLVEQNGRPRRALPGIAAGEEVGIHFSVPTSGKDQHFRLEGKIVRAMETGVGINFPNGMPEDVFKCLSEHSGMKPVRNDAPAADASGAAAAPASTPAAASAATAFRPRGIKPEDARKIVVAIRKEVTQIIPEMTTAFFTYMDNELLELAKDAKSNAEQSEYFAAMSAFEKGKKQVGETFLQEVLNQVDEPRDLQTLLEERKKASEERKAQSQKKIKLTLVNTEEFEDWLAVANMIQRSERMYEKYLDEIFQRLGMIVDAWGHNEANPLGPSVISHGFDEAMQQVDLSKEIRQKAYTGYENVVIPLFRKLYISATKLMEESGYFPDLDEDYVSGDDEAAAPVEEVAETPVSDEPEEVEAPEEEEGEFEELINLDGDDEEEGEPDEEELEPDEDEPEGGFDDLLDEILDTVGQQEEAPPAPAASARRRSSRRRGGTAASAEPPAASSRRRSSRRRSGQPDAQRARPARRDDVGEAIRSIYSSVRDLMTGRFGQQAVEEYEEDMDFFEEEEVHDLLSTLEDEVFAMQGQRVPVRQRLAETASLVGGRALAPQTLQNIEVVENLVDSIEEDALLTDSAKDWIRQLELTLDKVATRDEDFLSEANPHSSLEVINQLASLGGAETGSAKRAVDQIIQEINTGFDEDPEIFEAAKAKLAPLIERQNRAFTGNMQRAVKASQGQTTLANAQRAVVSEMDNRYAGREIPEVFYKLLMPGWRNLLVNTHLRQGAESPDWKKHVRALDQVFQHLDPNSDPTASPGYMEPEELIAHIEGGLDSISYEPGQRIPLVNSLRQVISGNVAPGEMPTIALAENTIAEDLGFAEVTKKEETRRKIREDHSDDRSWQRCFEKVQGLHVGAWLEFTLKAEPEINIAAWISEDATQFVFVNRRGVKTYDLSAEELATHLEKGEVRILDESDIPLTDRASHRMLQNMHNQLTHQATHDDLTGLLNRKEFEKALTEALEQAMREKSVHLCAYLDLDQFKVINNTGGHDAGDKLLVTIGELLTTKLDEHDVRLSRLGGDEFGILIHDCDADKGGALMKSIADEVRALRFNWEKDTFSLTVSCGLYYIDSATESVSKIMSGADSAVIAAKEAGRDRIQEYKLDDSEMEHRKDIMEFVSTIDRALDEDRFVLNCQKIQPIDPDNPDDHYEILLTILSEDNEPLPPQDFIIAAEQYNRMGAIDRWVIRNSFQFISTNILKLDHLGAFSINISGNSLTEPDFMEFVLAQFNETKLPTSKVCFEITETSAIGKLDYVIEFMEKMKIIGVHFSLDDFGTGLSSYSYLRNLPVDYLKIDGIFVKDIKNNPSDYAVVKSINEIGHFMGKKTIAEYVEDEEILEILREIGVDYAQGWGVGKKLPITTLLE